MGPRSIFFQRWAKSLRQTPTFSTESFLPREATRSAVLPWQVVRPSVRLSVCLSVRL